MGAKVRRTTDWTQPSNGNVGVPWDTEDYDTDGFWSAGLPEEFVVPAAFAGGTFALTFSCALSAVGTNPSGRLWFGGSVCLAYCPVTLPGSANGVTVTAIVTHDGSSTFMATLGKSAGTNTLAGTVAATPAFYEIIYLGGP